MIFISIGAYAEPPELWTGLPNQLPVMNVLHITVLAVFLLKGLPKFIGFNNCFIQLVGGHRAIVFFQLER